jgi:hypothetical protein
MTVTSQGTPLSGPRRHGRQPVGGSKTGALLISAGLAAPGSGHLHGARAGLAENAAREGLSRPIDNDYTREKAETISQ